MHWGGDFYADYESMAESLRSSLQLGLSGSGFWEPRSRRPRSSTIRARPSTICRKADGPLS
nr:hypothetical protein [Paenibacillus apii]